MASVKLPLVLRLTRLPSLINNGNSRFLSMTSRNFKTEEAKENPHETEISENEKKLTTDIATLNKQVEKLTEDNSELLDKYKRSLADGENLRKRLTKQIEDAKIFGIQSFCKDLLEVSDILGHATNAVPKNEIKESNPHLKNLYEGLCMTTASMEQMFKRHGLEAVNPINEKFNPNFHEALFQKDAENVEPNTVVEVTKIGYKLHERCLRPALVGVSKS